MFICSMLTNAYISCVIAMSTELTIEQVDQTWSKIHETGLKFVIQQV